MKEKKRWNKILRILVAVTLIAGIACTIPLVAVVVGMGGFGAIYFFLYLVLAIGAMLAIVLYAFRLAKFRTLVWSSIITIALVFLVGLADIFFEIKDKNIPKVYSGRTSIFGHDAARDGEILPLPVGIGDLKPSIELETILSVSTTAKYANLGESLRNLFDIKYYSNQSNYILNQSTLDSLRTGYFDIVFCDDYELLASLDTSFADDFTLTPLAQTAFVFYVNSENPLDELSISQIRDIYSGNIRNWKELKGFDEDIKAYQRSYDVWRESEQDADQQMMCNIMEDKTLIEPIREEFGHSRKYVRANYKNYKGAIGYSSIGTTISLQNRGVLKLLAIDGAYPSSENIQNKNYPYIQTVYALTRKESAADVQKLVDWLLADEGQLLMEKLAYERIK